RWSSIASVSAATLVDNQQTTNNDTLQNNVANNNTVDPKYDVENYLKQIPSDETQLKNLKIERDNAYYQLGLLYSERLEEYQVAAGKLEHLLSINPETGLIEPAKYHLYKIYLKIDSSKAQAMLTDLTTNHPN